MKKIMKVLGIVLLIIAAVLAVLFIKNKIAENKPYYTDNYYENFKSEFPLEQKYSQRGSCTVKKTVVKSDNKTIGKYYFFYPEELESNDKTYPMILFVNPSNARAKNLLPCLERLASWGFIVVGNDDAGTGNGSTASMTLDYILNLPQDNILCNRIDKDNMGIIGYSQGGAGALAAVTMYENGSLYKTVFTGSAAYHFMASNMGWIYDASKLNIPYFMTAGTGATDDAGVTDIEKEYGGVAPLASLIETYNKVDNNVFKIRARATGAEHGEMLDRSDGYMTAWMLFQLQGNQEASKVFVGEDAEILHNSNWQDIEKNH